MNWKIKLTNGLKSKNLKNEKKNLLFLIIHFFKLKDVKLIYHFNVYNIRFFIIYNIYIYNWEQDIREHFI